MPGFEYSFTPPEQPYRNLIVNAKVSKQEAAMIDALAVLLGIRGGRSGVIRKALDDLIASLPEETRENLHEMINATTTDD